MNEAAKANKNKAGYPKTDEVKEQNEEDESQNPKTPKPQNPMKPSLILGKIINSTN